MRERESAAALGRGFQERLSPLIVRSGVVPLPILLIRHQARLDLSHGELVYLLHVLARKWGPDWPWVAVGDVAAAAGVGITMARRWKAGLVAKGLLAASTRVVPGIGRRADLHDLTGLFAQLEALALEEELQAQLTQARGDLPAPRFHTGLSTVPQLPTGRRRDSYRPGSTQNYRARAAQKYRSHRPETTVPDRHKSADGREAVNHNRDSEPLRRARQPETGSTTNRVAAARPDEYPQADVSPAEHREQDDAAEDRPAPPGYFDPGIASAIERYGAEFGDDDVERTNDTVHHLWWNTRLPRGSVHHALKQAYYATRAKQRDGMIRSRPMAYYLGAVVNALAAACEEAGLPPPAGWKAAADAPAAGRRRARGAAG